MGTQARGRLPASLLGSTSDLAGYCMFPKPPGEMEGKRQACSLVLRLNTRPSAR
jgi:hypothetical protein